MRHFPLKDKQQKLMLHFVVFHELRNYTTLDTVVMCYTVWKGVTFGSYNYFKQSRSWPPILLTYLCFTVYTHAFRHQILKIPAMVNFYHAVFLDKKSPNFQYS